MGTELETGTIINTSFGEEYTVVKKLGEGGQGYVYMVEKPGVQKALKWYKNKVINEDFCKHIKKNVISGAPSDGFIWPLDTVDGGIEKKEFGYIMELKPDGYYDMEDYLANVVQCKSFKRVVDVALGIANSLRVLHNEGFSYQDLNDGNFFIELQGGKVLICDNDNVAINGETTGVLGKPRYMAPEIVRREKMPNRYSDYYSLALIIYRLLTKGHPLEGKRTTKGTLTPNLQLLFYGTDPIFIFDPEDDRNRPDPVIHKEQIDIWNCLPQYMKDIFSRAFSKTGLMKPNKRPSEVEWIDALVRFRSNIVRCKCGNEVFVNETGEAICDICSEKVDIPFWIELPEYRLPGVKDSRLYRCQTCVTDPNKALDPVSRVLAAKDDSGKLGIKNMCSNSWNALTSKGIEREVEPGTVVPLKEGIEFYINGITVKIKGGK